MIREISKVIYACNNYVTIYLLFAIFIKLNNKSINFVVLI